MNEDGHTSSIRDKILTITVKKGWKPETRITFPEEGDQGPNNVPGKYQVYTTVKILSEYDQEIPQSQTGIVRKSHTTITRHQEDKQSGVKPL